MKNTSCEDINISDLDLEDVFLSRTTSNASSCTQKTTNSHDDSFYECRIIMCCFSFASHNDKHKEKDQVKLT